MQDKKSDLLNENIDNQIRKFLKQVGVNTHQKINEIVKQKRSKSISVRMVLEIDGKHSCDYDLKI
tara:strand:- start:131 stop:325 length:195 start_codon:yes stop_codon:yes gene_type:complete